MIRITVELIPYGNENKKEIIAKAEIINDGTGNEKWGNYTYKLLSKDKIGRMIRYNNGNIKNFWRQNNIWLLISKIFEWEDKC